MGAGTSLPEDAVWREKEKFLSMTLDQKRRFYPGNFVPKENVKSWESYFLDEVPPLDRQQESYYMPHDVINNKVALWVGDITELEVDAIVNSAARPEDGGQVNMAIIRQAGDYYTSECCHNGLGAPGEAMLTGGYCLPARYVINTLSPKGREKHILRNCYTGALDMAKNAGIQSIAFPCIGTRKAKGFPMDLATELALETVRRWLEVHHSRIERVVFCVYSEPSIWSYRRLMQKYFPIRGHSMPSAKSRGEEDLMEESYQSDEETLQDEGQDLDDWRDDTVRSAAGLHEVCIERGDNEHYVKQLQMIYSVPTEELRQEPLVSFKGEDGIDEGGLAKEYFFESLHILAHSRFQDSPLFEGPMDHLLPCPSKVHMMNNLYYLAGKVLAHSVLHHGVGLCGLSPGLVFLLSHKVSQQELDYCGVPIKTDDVLDTDLRMLLQKDSTSELSDDDRMKLRDYMQTCNVGYMKIDGNFLFIKQELLLYEVILRRWPQIEAFRQGMDEFGLYTYLCMNPSKENVQEVFPTLKDFRILPHMILRNMTLVGDGGDAWGHFKDILTEIFAGKIESVTLNTLLLFWTGQPILPTSTLGAEVDPDTNMPQAITCHQRLFIPGGCADYEEFKEAFRIALQFGAKGFGEM